MNNSPQNLCVYIDFDLSMRSRIQWTVAGCFAALWQIWSVRRSLPPTTVKTLVMSIVLARLDYGNATLAGIPSNLLRCLQFVLNAWMLLPGLSLVFLRSTHITSSLARLYWLRVAEHIKFKLSTLLSLPCASPCYLSAQLTVVADIPYRRRLRSSATGALLVRPTRLVTVSVQAFPVAAAKLQNELPGDVTASIQFSVSTIHLKETPQHYSHHWVVSSPHTIFHTGTNQTAFIYK